MIISPTNRLYIKGYKLESYPKALNISASWSFRHCKPSTQSRLSSTIFASSLSNNFSRLEWNLIDKRDVAQQFMNKPTFYILIVFRTFTLHHAPQIFNIFVINPDLTPSPDQHLVSGHCSCWSTIINWINSRVLLRHFCLSVSDWQSVSMLCLRVSVWSQWVRLCCGDMDCGQ